MCHNDIQSVPVLLSWRSFREDASLHTLLRDLPGHMGHQLCFTATHKPLLSKKLCTARKKLKREGKKLKLALVEEHGCWKQLLIFTGLVPARVTQGAWRPRSPCASCNVTASCTESQVTSPPFPSLRDAEEIEGHYIWHESPASVLCWLYLPLSITNNNKSDCSSAARLTQWKTANMNLK